MAQLRERLARALAGRYTIERELGRGGMAVVFLARDAKHERAVALKVLRPELSAALGPERFLREIKVAARLAHPHILPLHDSDEADGLLYYTMPYVEGESLRRRLDREQRLPVADALQIAREVADALAYAHAQDLVHRDIKPENILFEAGHAVVADFGIARAISAARGDRMTAAGIAVGTPDYMSPEQAGGQEEVDGRSDVYSLGCVLYEMLSGSPPFTGRSAQEIMTGHVRATAESLKQRRPDLPLAVARAVEKALEKAPGARYSSAVDFATVLQEALRRSRPGAWPLLLLGRPRLLGVASGAVMVAGVVAVWAWFGRDDSRRVAAPLDPTHVAVLYFDDLSPDGGLGHVASGLTQDLIDELGAVPVLHVAPPSAVKPFRGGRVPLDSVARTLEVGTLVEGSVASSGERLRVRVALIDPAGPSQLHSQTVERPFGELFALQDELKTEVSNWLRVRLGRQVKLREQRSGTNVLAAWTAFQRADSASEHAWTLLNRYDVAAAGPRFGQADSLYATAAALDRRWRAPVLRRGWNALGHARVVWEEAFLTGQGEQTLQRDSPAGRAFEAWVGRGLAYGRQAGDRPEADELRGTLLFELWVHYPPPAADTLIAAAELALQDAVRAKPTLARAWYTLSDLYRQRGRFDLAYDAGRRAFAADAYLNEARTIATKLYFSALNREQFDEARYWCAEGARRFPDALNFIDCELRILGWSGRGRTAARQAWRLLAEVERRDTASSLLRADRRMLVAAVLARSGLADSARAVAREARAMVTNAFVLAELAPIEAYVRLLLGEREQALRLLGEALRASPQMREYAAQSAWFRPLHGDPRFEALVRPDSVDAGAPAYGAPRSDRR